MRTQAKHGESGGFKSHIKLASLRELSYGERSGYDLMKLQRVSPGYIYPLLRELESAGYVRMRKMSRRKLYRITAQGTAALKSMKLEHEKMLRRLVALHAPFAEREELKRYVAFKQRLYDHRTQLMEDRDVYEGLHDAMFRVYDGGDRAARERMRATLKKAAKEMRRGR